MLEFSLYLIAFTLIFANAFVWRKEHYRRATIVGFIGLVLSAPLFLGAIFPAAAANCVVLITITGIWSTRSYSVGSFRWASLVSALAGVAVGAALSLPYVFHLHALRQEYPLVSVRDRLAYEVAHSARHQDDRAARYRDLPPRDAPAWQTMSAFEQRTEGRSKRRQFALREIHASSVAQFRMAPGFGVARMSAIPDFVLRDSRTPPIMLADTIAESSPTVPSNPLKTYAPVSGGKNGSSDAFANEIWELHVNGLNEFTSLARAALIIDRDRVAGMEPHAFGGEFPGPNWTLANSDRSWVLVRLELVSLLKAANPSIYVSGSELPQMGRLQQYPLRELNAFERAGLEQLRSGEDLAYCEDKNQLTALGSLRAQKDCIQCHGVERGTLLGAFSYKFRRHN